MNHFPVTSESFIQRTAEMIVDYLDAKITIIALSGYNASQLEESAPEFMRQLESGKVEVVSGPFQTPFLALRSFVGSLLRYPIATCQTSHYVISLSFKEGIRFKHAIKGGYLAGRLANFKKKEELIVQPQFLSLGISCSVASDLINARRGVKEWGVVCHIRGSDISSDSAVSAKEFTYLKASSRSPKYFLASSDSLRKMAIARGLNDKNVATLYSPLNTHLMSWRTEPCYPRKGFRMIQVGRLVEKKGGRMSVMALASLPDTTIRLEIAGDGPERKFLKNLAESLGVADRVAFLGALPQKDVLRRIQAADLLLVPSLMGRNGDSEGIPNVIKEAMALGTIVVASNHSGAPEIVEDGVNGYLFPEGKQESFLDVLGKALDSLGEWPILRDAARKTVVSRFDSAQVARELESFYRRLVSSR
ncbi:glycosyltransferase [Halomonas sp. C05BenzN]|uniref:glycosyltransferase n=1 Tax=Halomonas sp. C05BenzN TaxID=3411041 RepID=UPI003B92BCA8